MPRNANNVRMLVTAREQGIHKLYRYERFSCKYLKDFLINRRVHVSNIGNVNDPWDCRPHFDRDITDPQRRAQWVKYFSTLTVKQTTLSRLQANDSYLAENTEDLAFHHPRIVMTGWRILCLSVEPNNPLMWAHYGDRHKGVCFEFDTENEVFGGAHPVQYDVSPVWIGPDNIQAPGTAEKILLTKASCWSYEREYRVLCRDGKVDQEPLKRISKSMNDFILLPEGALTSVIVGCRADFDHVLALVEKYGAGIKVVRANFATKSHALEFSEC